MPIDGQPKSIVRDLEDMARTYIKVGCAPMHLWFCTHTGDAKSNSLRSALAWALYLGRCSQSGLVPKLSAGLEPTPGQCCPSCVGTVAAAIWSLQSYREVCKSEVSFCTCRVTTPLSWL